MPIAAGASLLQNLIKASLSFQQGAQVKTTASLVSVGVASVAPMGLLPLGPSLAPLVPSGVSAGLTMIEQALSLGQGAQKSVAAALMANGISLIAPLAPPAGLSILKQLIELAMSMDKGANIDATASQIATAVITYYTCGGVI